jgi:UDP-N-acetyl-D-mannosaminuronic acid dehydrogenase
MNFETVSVIGLGYIGLPTAAIIASRGIDVTGIDVSEEVVDTINRGQVHIVEPDLDIIVRSVVQIGKLTATTRPAKSEVFIIAVPTPFKGDHEPDLSFIKNAAKMIAPVLEKGNLIILESTSPVGTTEMMADWLAEARPDLSFPPQGQNEADINLAYCPERVLPGNILQELVSNDRLIGGMSEICSKKAESLYKTFVRGECIITNARTAELAKLAENSFRDVNIAFANELSIICDKLKINVWELVRLSNRHPRVNILNPGPGVGGHCIAVDPWFIVNSCPEDAKIIRQARLTNDAKPLFVSEKIVAAADQFKKPVIACLGLAFKADIDDLRESPALQIVEVLASRNIGQIVVVEPNIQALPESLRDSGVTLTSLERAMETANIVVVLVDHKQFKAADKGKFATKIVIDTRGLVL